MKLANFTIEQLKQLPLRAIVAFAARCARRVEPLAQLPTDHPERKKHRGATDAALVMAEGFARGSNSAPDESLVEAIDKTRAFSRGSLGSEYAAAAVAEA